jgi:hypothetical protein
MKHGCTAGQAERSTEGLSLSQRRYLKSWRRVHVSGDAWLYRVGRGGGVVIHGPNGEQVRLHAANLKGQWPSDFERGQWKRTSDGALTPAHVKLFIEVGLALGTGDVG